MKHAIAAALLVVLVPATQAARSAKVEAPRKIDPEEQRGSEAYVRLRYANQYLQQGLLAQAKQECLDALRIQPAFPEASYTLGLVLLELKDYRGALTQAQAILDANPYFTEAHNLRGLAFARMGNLDDALRAFEAVKADASFPTPEVAHFNIGRIFWERQACAEAVLHFRRAVEINPRMTKAWYLLGDCQARMGQAAPARTSYERALEGQPDDPEPNFGLGFLCYKTGDLACARLYLTRVLELAPSSEMASQSRQYLHDIDFR